jgi:hypothetical protein
MKWIYVLALSLGPSGCRLACSSADTTYPPQIFCVQGISYVQLTFSATVQVDAEGKPLPCKVQ